jgi:hypothetical protein
MGHVRIKIPGIADEIGADEKTVRKARQTADQSAVDDEPRVGLDGKQRRRC